MAQLRRIVLDVLKPHEPGILPFTARISEIEGVDGTNAALVEIDERVKNLKLTVEGEDLDFDAITAEIEELSGSVHSVDEVSFGEYIVEDRPTPQE